jgi:hypothetical protein
LLDQKGDFIPEKTAMKPVKILKIKEAQCQEVIDLFIFKKVDNIQQQQGEYCMYLIATQGVLVYRNIEKKDEAQLVIDEQNLIMTPNCADCDARGLLLLDAAQSNNYNNNHLLEHKDAQEHFVKRYNMRQQVH